MKILTKKNLVWMLFLILPYAMYSQGCSDAGFCTIDSFKPHEHEDEVQNKNQFKIGLNFGLHFQLSLSKAGTEGFTLEHHLHVFLQGFGAALGQNDVYRAQPPQDGCNTAIHQREFFVHEERLLSENRRYADAV